MDALDEAVDRAAHLMALRLQIFVIDQDLKQETSQSTRATWLHRRRRLAAELAELTDDTTGP